MIPSTGGPRSFVDSFIRSIDEGYKAAGARSLVPVWFLATIVAPTIAVIVGRQFGQSISNDTLIMILTALMTVEGILAAVSVSAMVQVQQIVCEYPFSDYLESEGLFDSFIFIPQFTFVVQCLSAVACVVSIVATQFAGGHQFTLLVICCGIFLYTMVRTLGLVDLIRVLSWHYGKYQIMLEQERASMAKED